MLLLSTPKFQSIGCHPKRWKHAKHVGFFVDLKGGEIFAYAAYHMPIPCFTSSLSHLNSPLCCPFLFVSGIGSSGSCFGLRTVGGFNGFNPFEKYARQIASFPQAVVKIKRNM